MRNVHVIKHHWLQIAATSALLASTATPALAAGVVVCNNCNAPQQAARQGGAGTVLVPDFKKRKLWAFENERDRESGQLLPVPKQVPPRIEASYFRVVNIPDTAGANIIVRQDGRGNNAGMFPKGFDGANAALVAGDVNLQNALGTALATNYVGANMDSILLNDLAFELISLGLDFVGAAVGFDGVTITLTWNDGSKTVMKIKGNNVTQAEYVKGASYDADGNKLPDASAIRNADSYIGSYTFQRDSRVEDWVNNAAQYGIPIHGSRTRRMSCTWDGNTLACRYY